MFSKELHYQEHTRRYSIAATQAGWEVREERDNEVVKQAQYQDWHRVERALRTFTIELDDLRRQGWLETTNESSLPVPRWRTATLRHLRTLDGLCSARERAGRRAVMEDLLHSAESGAGALLPLLNVSASSGANPSTLAS